MPPRRSQRIAVASSTSQPTRSMNPRPVPAAAPVTKPATKRRRIATPESEEDDADDDDDSGDASDGDATEDEAPAPKRKPKPTKSKASGSAVQDAPSQWKKVRGKRGILQKIADTPLDVLFEVRAHIFLVFCFCLNPNPRYSRIWTPSICYASAGLPRIFASSS